MWTCPVSWLMEKNPSPFWDGQNIVDWWEIVAPYQLVQDFLQQQCDDYTYM